VDQICPNSRYLVVRTTGDPNAMIPAVVGEVQALDPDLPVYDVATMDRRFSDSLARRRFSTLLLGALAAVASLLAAIGIYGVLAYAVNQRTHEIGVRMALGAGRRDIVRLVVGQAVVMVALGIAAGLVGALALTRVMESLLFGVSATDAATFVAVPLVLAAIALVASYIPARRATRVDPLVALRHE
jgi:putative ABC transport system permease protein